MSYTQSLIRMGLDCLPFADQIPYMQQKAPVISKKEERARLNVAKAMQKAMKEGTLPSTPALRQSVKQMKKEATTRLNEQKTHQIKKKCESGAAYLCNQVAKAGPLLNLIPGAGILPVGASYANKVITGFYWSAEAPSLAVKAQKVGLILAPVALSQVTPYILPTITECVTPILVNNLPIIAGGSAAAVGAFLAVDAYVHGAKNLI